MFITALFTIAKIWKQPKCPSTEDWIRKMWHIYTMEYYSVIKKNDIMPFSATWMELETLILSEVRKRKTNTIWYHLNWNLLYSINEHFHGKENHRLGAQTRGCPGRRRREWEGPGVWG